MMFLMNLPPKYTTAPVTTNHCRGFCAILSAMEVGVDFGVELPPFNAEANIAVCAMLIFIGC
jgi:hypothetical protein